MAGALRIEYAGAVCHITSRGDRREGLPLLTAYSALKIFDLTSDNACGLCEDLIWTIAGVSVWQFLDLKFSQSLQ